MYEPLLLVHSWIRWAVFLGSIYFLLRSATHWWKHAPWTGQDSYFIWVFSQIFGYQIGFGVTLWLALSPMTKAGFKSPSLILENGVITFWVLRHALTMILAFGVFHLGRARSKKVHPNDRFKIYTITFAVVVAMIVSAIPWPWLSYGRALFRRSRDEVPTALPEILRVWRLRCRGPRRLSRAVCLPFKTARFRRVRVGQRGRQR